MDTSNQVLGEVRTRRRWTIEEKRRITQETFVSGASVARIAQRYALNANQLFHWRQLYREGRLGSRATAKLIHGWLSGPIAFKRFENSTRSSPTPS